ncbi:MAG: response regulator transcription factor [Bacteroidota bacterium]
MQKIGLAIVDDHALFRSGLASMFDFVEHIDVRLRASNGQELLDALGQQDINVVLLDLDMPVMDGLEATPKLKAQYPDLKILILSMHDDDGYILKLMELGANGYLLKDAEIEEVILAIDTVHQKGLFFNDRVAKAMHTNLVGNHTKAGSVPQTTPDPLTDREREVLIHICNELTTAEIAEKMFLSPRTIEGYRNRLLEKTGARNTAGLVVYAARKGMVN